MRELLEELVRLPPGALGEHLLVLLAAAACAALVTRGVIRLAPRWGLVSQPSETRHAARAAPLGGGLALFVVIGFQMLILPYDLPALVKFAIVTVAGILASFAFAAAIARVPVARNLFGAA